MNRSLTFVRMLMVLTLAAFALPAVAASGNNKIYNLFDDLPTVSAGTKGATANIEFDNISPDGNSTFKSLKLFAPSGITVTAAQVQAGSSYTASVTVRDAAGNIVPAGTPGTAVWVDVINLPVKPFGPSFVLALTLNADCSGTGGPWTTVSGNKENVYTGTGWTGQTFAQNNRDAQNPGPYSTTITGACTYKYSITGVPLDVTAGTTTSQATVTVKNDAASAASIDSGFTLTPPTGLTVALVNPPNNVSPSGTGIKITSPIAPSGSVSFDITVTSTTSSCGPPSGGGAWSLTYTPTQFTGTIPSTTIDPSNCTLTFKVQPNNALAGQKITNKSFDPSGSDVSVQALINGSPAGTGVSVSVANAACSISGNGSSATTDANGVADFSALVSTASSTVAGCTLTAKATNFSDSAPSTSFEIAAGADGVLGCDSGNNTAGHLGSLVLTQSGFEGTADWGLVRGNNWGGDLTCTLVPYKFSFDGSQGVASFVVDDAIKADQKISAEYVVLFNPVAASAWPTFHPKVAWGSSFGVGGATPAYPQDYVPVLACLDDDVNGVSVLPAIPSSGDFSADYAAAVANGNPQYAAPGPAMMCVANTGWTSMTLDSGNIYGLPPGAYVQPWYKIIDRSDGYLKQ